MKYIVAVCASLCLCSVTAAQSDSANMAGIFHKITSELKSYTIDTSEVPDDRITRKIRELRDLRGGFNINEAISFKMQEDESKGEVSRPAMNFLKEQFGSGKGRRWLDNATIWIYRRHFTFKELKQMVRFYKTSAGQKLAEDFPLIMMKSLAAAQIIHDQLMKEVKK